MAYLRADMVKIQRNAERCARLADYMLSDPRVSDDEPMGWRFPCQYSVTDQYAAAFKALSAMS